MQDNRFLSGMGPFMKMITFVMILLASMLLTMFLGVLAVMPFYGTGVLDKLTGMNNLSDPGSVQLLKYFQIVNQVGVFFVPVLLFGLLFRIRTVSFLTLDRKPDINTVVLAIILIFSSLPFLSWTSDLNALMKMPENLKGLETWMKASEDQAAQLTRAFLEDPSYRGFMVNLFMIGVLPAFGEEFVFRGIFQRLFTEWFRNPHAAVVVTALFFSSMHLQFYGFLPRFLLGLFLGYLFYWSRTLWVPILVHFVNNAVAVVVAFLSSRDVIRSDYETFGTTHNTYFLVITTLISFSVLFLIFLIEQRKKQERP